LNPSVVILKCADRYCWGGAHAVKLATIPGVIDTSLPIHPGGSFKADMPNSVVPIAYFIPEGE